MSTAVLDSLRRLRAVRGRTVQIVRDGVGAGTAQAIPAGISETAAALRGVAVPVNRRDYIVLAEDYLIGGTAMRPERDDLLIDGAKSWRVVSANPASQVYETIGPAEEAYRVHVVEAGG